LELSVDRSIRIVRQLRAILAEFKGVEGKKEATSHHEVPAKKRKML
jgi:hypothetical protein